MGIFSTSVPAAACDYAQAALDRLYPAAYSLTGNRPEAEDLVQETLYRVMTRWSKVEQANSRDAYVRQILMNTFLSGRRRRSASELPMDQLPEVPVHRPDVADRLGLLQQLDGLSRPQRAVLVLRYFEDLPDAAIAEVLDMSVGNVRVVAHRALTSLRASLSSTS